MNESRIERRFRNEVRKHGGKALKFTSPGVAGMPDRIVLLPGGKVVFAELKAPGEIMEPLQLYQADCLRKMGFAVYCIDSLDAVSEFIAEVFGCTLDHTTTSSLQLKKY